MPQKWNASSDWQAEVTGKLDAPVIILLSAFLPVIPLLPPSLWMSSCLSVSVCCLSLPTFPHLFVCIHQRSTVVSSSVLHHILRQGLSMNLELSNYKPSQPASHIFVSTSQAKIGLCHHTENFLWVSGIWIQVITLAWQAFYGLNYLLGPRHNLLEDCLQKANERTANHPSLYSVG